MAPGAQWLPRVPYPLVWLLCPGLPWKEGVLTQARLPEHLSFYLPRVQAPPSWQTDLELLILPPLLPGRWGERHAPLHTGFYLKTLVHFPSTCAGRLSSAGGGTG